MLTDGCLYLRRDASGNFVPVKSQPLGDVWISIHALREESDPYGSPIKIGIRGIRGIRDKEGLM